jgi:3-dehydroquinate synthetase
VTVLVEIDAEEAWRRVGGSDRPLAQDEAAFRTLYDERQPLYDDAADARTWDVDGAVLAAGGVHCELGALERLGELVPGEGPVEIVSDARVAGIYGMDVQLALGARARASHELAPGEQAKTVESLEALWHALRLERGGTLIALGGGCTTDVAGFAAATYLRGIDWVAVPTTLVGQVDAAIGGKTAIDLPDAKNLVGAFHWPVRTVIDPATLETLPEAELANGRAEVVKTGLLAGEPFWELPLPEQVRRAAAFKTALCLRDPHDRSERAQLNLGHTFAHALEAAAAFELPHGQAVALGLLAALRLSGLDTAAVEQQLRPEPVRVDRDEAWAALSRDKKVVDGVPRLVLLEAPGRPRLGVELPAAEVRAALDSLIAG